MNGNISKYQEALNRIGRNYYLSNESGDFEHFENLYLENKKTLQELVDRATPKKPNEYESQSGESYECKCGYPLPIVKHKDCFMDSEGCVNNFCRFCGQALDWSEDEE